MPETAQRIAPFLFAATFLAPVGTAVAQDRPGRTNIEEALAFGHLLGQHRRSTQHAGDDHQHGRTQENGCLSSHLSARRCLVDGGIVEAIHPRRPRQDLETGAPFKH